MPTSLSQPLDTQLPPCFATTLHRLLATTAALWLATDTAAEI